MARKNRVTINKLVDECDIIDEKSTLCIKNGRPTNYIYNKDFPEYPICKSGLNCVYKHKT